MTILDRIIEHKQRELSVKMKKTSLEDLKRLPGYDRKTVSLTRSLLDPERTGIIAEFKRMSPSGGILNQHATIEEVTTGYFRAGASALSVLTDKEFFGGSAEDLMRAREINPIPILRKDFILHEYQVIESKAMGADVLLLIAAVLDRAKIKKLAVLARSVQLEVILEIHEPSELKMLDENITAVGVNNRDLRDFSVDTDRSVKLAPLIPREFLRISESGIHSPMVIQQLRSCGYNGFLVGEKFMREPDPATAFAAFIKLLIQNQ
jgi:indole-3-glycerol phosphate synthase